MPAPKGKKKKATVNTDKQQKPWLFEPGTTGNPKGRPKGSRNKLGEAFLADLYQSWQKHGAETLEAVRADKPDVYVKVVASILPKELNVNHDVLGELTTEELDNYATILQSIVDSAGQGQSDAGEGPTGTATTH